MRFIAALFFFAGLAQASASDPPGQAAPQCASIKTEYMLDDGRSFGVSVDIAPHVKAAGQPAFDYGGDSKLYLPRLIVQGMSLSVAGHSIVVPPTAYNDLGDPWVSPPEVFRTGKTITVRIHGGGEGWTAYYADLVIVHSAITARRVANVMKETTAKGGYKPDVKNFK